VRWCGEAVVASPWLRAVGGAGAGRGKTEAGQVT
jgi:hypothetical protein